MKLSFSIFLLATACAPSYNIQPPQPMRPIAIGDRLRVSHNAQCCSSPSIGVAESLTRDSLVLRSPGSPARLAIARSSINHIERWNQQSLKARGAFAGFVFGMLGGGFIGFHTCSNCHGDSRALGAFAGALGGGLIGSLAGLLVGAHHGSWETVP